MGNHTIPRNRLPFQNLNAASWLNLAVACVLAFYLFYLVWETRLGTMCGQMGVDYCDFLSAARVASAHGYAKIYDLSLIEQVERSLLPPTADPTAFGVVPFPYLPVFVLPFQLLAFLTPSIGFWIWNVVNIMAFVLYIRFFARNTKQPQPSARLMLMLFACLPMFLNIFSGQVAVWLTVCVGEFMRAVQDHKPFRAGLWLGGLLIKPQVLVLLCLVLLLQRAFRLLAGLAAACSGLVAASLGLIGPGGLLQMLQLWLFYARGRANNWIEAMMNWRMLGHDLAMIINPTIAWTLAVLAMTVTLLIVLWVWRRPFDASAPSFPVAILGILAATTVWVWHSHIHTALVLIPPLIYVYQAGLLPERALGCWILVPALAYIVVIFAPEALSAAKISFDPAGRFIYFFVGAAELAVTLYLFGWSVRAYGPRG